MTAHVPFRLRGTLALLTLAATVAVQADSPPERLTSRPRSAAPAVKPLAVGEEVRTEAGQRRRAVLPDGSVVYASTDTTIKVNAPRRLSLAAGEVFVEV